MKRRQFLKAGAIGGAVLAAGGAWVVWRDARDADARAASGDRVATILGAIAPVLLAGTLPDTPEQRAAGLARVVSGVKAVIAEFPPGVRGEIGDLFRLLDIRVARRVLTGVGDWNMAPREDIAAFLERWRLSRIGLLQSGYFALHDLVLGAWYADASAWEGIGYAGPPDVA